jgi:GxxExxY protein
MSTTIGAKGDGNSASTGSANTTTRRARREGNATTRRYDRTTRGTRHHGENESEGGIVIRVPSRLDDATEGYVSEAMDCGFAVHREIGPGYDEKIYENAFCIELLARRIPFECERRLVVKYRDKPVGLHKLDLIVRGKVLVELKAVKTLERFHEAQVVAYLKSSELPVALLMNFGGATLKEGLRRIVRSDR